MGLSFEEAKEDLHRFLEALKRIFKPGFLCDDCRTRAIKELKGASNAQWPDE